MPQCSTGFLKIVSIVIAVFSFLLNFSFLFSKMLANFSYHSEKFAKLRNTPSIKSYFKSSEYNDHPKYSRKSLPTSLDWPIELQQKHYLTNWIATKTFPGNTIFLSISLRKTCPQTQATFRSFLVQKAWPSNMFLLCFCIVRLGSSPSRSRSMYITSMWSIFHFHFRYN